MFPAARDGLACALASLPPWQMAFTFYSQPRWCFGHCLWGLKCQCGHANFAAWSNADLNAEHVWRAKMLWIRQVKYIYIYKHMCVQSLWMQSWPHAYTHMTYGNSRHSGSHTGSSILFDYWQWCKALGSWVLITEVAWQTHIDTPQIALICSVDHCAIAMGASLRTQVPVGLWKACTKI